MHHPFVTPINKAMLRPVLIAGVEKRLVILNGMLCFPLIAATHAHCPSCLVGVAVFALLHRLLITVSKYDPHMGLIIKRASRYVWRPFYFAKSHPSKTDVRPVNSIGY